MNRPPYHPYQVPASHNTSIINFGRYPSPRPHFQAPVSRNLRNRRHLISTMNMNFPGKWTGVFKFKKLPTKIQTLIIHYATAPPSWRVAGFTGGRKEVYKTTLSLMLVNKYIFQRASSALLDVVILSSQEKLNKFLETVQKDFRKVGLDPKPLLVPVVGYSLGKVNMLWVSECYQPSSGHPGLLSRNPAENSIWGWYIMYYLFRRTYTVGFCFKALDMLYEVIRASADVLCDAPGRSKWSMETRALVLAGSPLPGWTWSPITHTLAGKEFLRCIRHLTIWRPETTTYNASSDHSQIAPGWVQDIPFEHMPNLTHFSFTTYPRPQDLRRRTLPVIAYTLPGHPWSRYRNWQQAGYPVGSIGNQMVFKEWALSGQPAAHGWNWLVPIEKVDSERGEVRDENWEMAFLRGFHDSWSPVFVDSTLK